MQVDKSVGVTDVVSGAKVAVIESGRRTLGESTPRLIQQMNLIPTPGVMSDAMWSPSYDALPIQNWWHILQPTITFDTTSPTGAEAPSFTLRLPNALMDIADVSDGLATIYFQYEWMEDDSEWLLGINNDSFEYNDTVDSMIKLTLTSPDYGYVYSDRNCHVFAICPAAPDLGDPFLYSGTIVYNEAVAEVAISTDFSTVGVFLNMWADEPIITFEKATFALVYCSSFQNSHDPNTGEPWMHTTTGQVKTISIIPDDCVFDIDKTQFYSTMYEANTLGSDFILPQLVSWKFTGDIQPAGLTYCFSYYCF